MDGNRQDFVSSRPGVDHMFQLIMEREKFQEDRRREEEQRRWEEEQLRERKRHEEEKQRRQEESERWEMLLQRVITSTSSSSNMLGSVPKLPKLQDSDDIEAYIYTFERHMETYKVEKLYWVAQLAPLLRGMAQKAYMSVPREASNNYDEVKEAILRRYDIGEDTYRQRFASAVPQEKESYSQFSARTGDLLDKWAKNCFTGKDWRELIGTERVLNAMPHNVQAWVRDKKPKNMVEAGKLADDYVRNRNFEYGAGNWHYRRNDDHHFRKNERRSFRRSDDQRGGQDRDGDGNEKNAKEKGDDKSGAIRGSGGNGAGGTWRGSSGNSYYGNKFSRNFDKNRGPQCFSCKKWGHVSAQCLSKTENANYSGQWQNHEDDGRAIMYEGTIEGKSTPRLRVDSGADRTLVHPKWVPDEAYLGKSQLFRNAWGDVRSLPLAEVQLTVDGKSYSLDVAVTKGLAYDALLGRDIPELTSWQRDLTRRGKKS